MAAEQGEREPGTGAPAPEGRPDGGKEPGQGVRAQLDAARAMLHRHWGHRQFRGVQVPAVRAGMEGRDLLAVLPTGTGKSVCFQVPALLAPHPTLVVAPLVALIQDQVEGLRRRGVRAEGLWAGRSRVARRRVDALLRRGALDLLYVAPERLWTPAFGALLSATRLSRIVVDEAHCISEWGHDFRPRYLRLGAFADRVGRPPVSAFTATATPAVRREIRARLRLRRPTVVRAPVDRPNLRLEAARAPTRRAGLRDGIRAVRETPGACIVYVGTRRRSVEVAASLARAGFRAAPYHAGLTGDQRRAVQAGFLGGEVRAACATSAFGMGVDHSSVRLVLHLGLPGSLEAYVQEAGRAGRDGRPARCRLVALPGDGDLRRALVARNWPRPGVVRRVWRAVPESGGAAAAELLPRLPRRLPRREAELQGALRALLAAGGIRQVHGPGSGGAVRYVRESPALGAAPGLDRLERGRRRALGRYRAVLDYRETTGCRRAFIARHFGEARPRCAGCDRCVAAEDGPASF